MEITKKQRLLMEHTVSGNDRNWFGTNYGTLVSKEFEKLVKAGLAIKEPPPKWTGDEVIYRLTAKGKEAISHERS